MQWAPRGFGLRRVLEGKSYEWTQSLTQHCQAWRLACGAADWDARISCRPDGRGPWLQGGNICPVFDE